MGAKGSTNIVELVMLFLDSFGPGWGSLQASTHNKAHSLRLCIGLLASIKTLIGTQLAPQEDRR